MLYRKDPIFNTWNHVESYCHAKVKQAHKKLRSYFIDAMTLDDIANIQKNGYIAITNSILNGSVSNTSSVLRVNDSFYGVYYYSYKICHPAPTKGFNCFINRIDPFRQSWLYQLVRRNLFEKGYVSFNMDISRIPSLQKLTQEQAFEYQFQKYNSIFKDEHDKVRNLLPYKNFIDTGDITNTVIDSNFSIILETYFDNNDIITYSEKIFRCLQLPRPWVLFSHQHAVSHLKNMGFDLLEDIVDHDYYDQLTSPVDRQAKILDIAENLIFLDVKKLNKRLMSAAQHNQNILNSWSTTWKHDLDKTISTALEKLNVK